jgi:hypothetical protein
VSQVDVPAVKEKSQTWETELEAALRTAFGFKEQDARSINAFF